MADDASLDDFFGADDEADADADDAIDKGDEDDAIDKGDVDDANDERDVDGEDAPTGTASDAATERSATPEPAVATYRWDPDGVRCGRCGETVERVWFDDGGYVCRDCKTW
ncbi:DUF7573 domain-containing protein [Haloferacaceae archaeon DSL9]